MVRMAWARRVAMYRMGQEAIRPWVRVTRASRQPLVIPSLRTGLALFVEGAAPIVILSLRRISQTAEAACEILRCARKLAPLRMTWECRMTKDVAGLRTGSRETASVTVYSAGTS